MRSVILLNLFFLCFSAVLAQQDTTFKKAQGYKGIWFELGQVSTYGDKYSGGLGTYTAKHRPLAIYDSTSNKTFFVYGGTTGKNEKHLQCMISYYDHSAGKIPRPVIVYDKKGVDDPHDNPSLLIDDKGYLWVFVSGRGTARMGYKYRSTDPYKIDTFKQVTREEMTYPQPWYIPKQGYFHFFTKYSGMRELYFETSRDGHLWSKDRKLAGIKRPDDEQAGHYQISSRNGEKLATFFNWHPNGNVDSRTNLYYLETKDMGKTWHTADHEQVSLPVTKVDHPALVEEYFSKHKNVYLKDINFDQKGNPIALFIVSNGHKAGPDNGLRHWKVAHWNEDDWNIHDVCTSDHNYDMGSLYVEEHFWWVIAPTTPGPQPWGTGGDMVIWESSNLGKSWNQVMQVTSQTEYNHTYMRRPVNAHREFYGFWADGNPESFSSSRLYFMNKAGKIFPLPYEMDGSFKNIKTE